MAARSIHGEISVRIFTAQHVILICLASGFGCGDPAPEVTFLSQDTANLSPNPPAPSDVFNDSDGIALTDTSRPIDDDLSVPRPSDVAEETDSGGTERVDTAPPAEDTRNVEDVALLEDTDEALDIEASTDTDPPQEDTDTPQQDTDAPQEDTDTPPIEPAPNLLANPGFEDGTEPWNIWGGAQRLEGNANSGGWAVQATNGNGAEQLVVNLEPNATYRLTGWGKSLANQPMLIGIKNYGGPQKAIQFTSPDYEEGTVLFTTGFSNTTAVVFAYKHQGAEPGYADDFSLQLESLEAKTPIWADEFNGDGPLDATKWTFEEGFVRNKELQWYQSENAFQEGGNLVIEGRTEDKANPNYIPGSESWKTNQETIKYSSASVITKDLFSFQYATVVVRAKVTNDVGTWPAIWTLGVDCPWPSRGEVDIMENYGGNVLANFAWGTDTKWSPVWDSSKWPVADFGPGWTDSFHIWELQWTDTTMTILLDGQVLNDVDLTQTINGSAGCEGENPFQQPHYLLLNLALGSNGGSVENLTFPTQYLVDYVRIYK
jgi:beta-glucanase (GH16 family)